MPRLTAAYGGSDSSGAVNGSDCREGGTCPDLIGTPPFGEANSPLRPQMDPLQGNRNNTAALVHHDSPSSSDSAYNDGLKFW